MALSKLKPNFNLSVVLTEQYFHLVYQKYGTPYPEDASWKEVKELPSLNGHTRTFQEVPNMLFEIADLFEDARVEEMVKKCERLRLNSGNIYAQFTGTITTLLDNGLTWGKVVVFFSFAVSFAIYLCTHDMSHLAARVCVWAAQVLQNRLQPWIDENGGWVSSAFIVLLFAYTRPHNACYLIPLCGGMLNYLLTPFICFLSKTSSRLRCTQSYMPIIVES